MTAFTNNAISKNDDKNRFIVNFKQLLFFSVFSVPLAIFFYLGVRYSDSKSSKIQYIPQEKIITVYPSESPSDLIDRCGVIPISIISRKQHYDVMQGPAWSPDCRHIAWSLWESGTSYLGDDPIILKEMENNPRQLSGREGIFIVTDATQKIQKIYNPKKLDETPEFIRWEDSDSLIFKSNNTKFKYVLSSRELTIAEN